MAECGGVMAWWWFAHTAGGPCSVGVRMKKLDNNVLHTHGQMAQFPTPSLDFFSQFDRYILAELSWSDIG